MNLVIASCDTILTPPTTTLSSPSSQTVIVKFATVDGTATTADNDYVANAGTLVFDPGNVTKSIHVLLNGDIRIEPDEIFYVDLSNPTNATIARTRGIATIVNDDYGLPVAAFTTAPNPAQCMQMVNFDASSSYHQSSPSPARSAYVLSSSILNRRRGRFHFCCTWRRAETQKLCRNIFCRPFDSFGLAGAHNPR